MGTRAKGIDLLAVLALYFYSALVEVGFKKKLSAVPATVLLEFI